MFFKLKKSKGNHATGTSSEIEWNNQFSNREMTEQTNNFQDEKHDKNKKTASEAT